MIQEHDRSTMLPRQRTVPKIETLSPAYRRDLTMRSKDPPSCCAMFVCWILNLRHIARIFCVIFVLFG